MASAVLLVAVASALLLAAVASALLLAAVASAALLVAAAAMCTRCPRVYMTVQGWVGACLALVPVRWPARCATPGLPLLWWCGGGADTFSPKWDSGIHAQPCPFFRRARSALNDSAVPSDAKNRTEDATHQTDKVTVTAEECVVPHTQNMVTSVLSSPLPHSATSSGARSIGDGESSSVAAGLGLAFLFVGLVCAHSGHFFGGQVPFSHCAVAVSKDGATRSSFVACSCVAACGASSTERMWSRFVGTKSTLPFESCAAHGAVGATCT